MTNLPVYSIVTKDVCKNWDKTGKNQILKCCQKGLVDEGKPTSISQENDVRRVLYEVIRQVLMKTLKNDHLVALLTSLKETNASILSLFVDVVTLVDVELQSSMEENKTFRRLFVSLIKAAMDVVGTTLLKERLDVETLENLELIPNTKLFQQKYIKTKTRLFYKQQKFNLLREEMEGYSKLLTELGQMDGRTDDHTTLLQNIKSLIGCFNIDPNRALDLLLDAFECHVDAKVFLPLLENYLVLCERSTLCQLIGHKFTQFKKSGKETPQSLYIVSAMLIQHKLVSIEDLWIHLSPDDSMIAAEWEAVLAATAEEVRKANIVSLADKKDEETDKKEKTNDKIPENQKFGVIEAMLLIGDWKSVRAVMTNYHSSHLMSQKSIAIALCQLIAAKIDPFYRRVASVKGSLPVPNTRLKYAAVPPSVVGEFGDLSSEIFDMLDCIGPMLSLEPLLLAKMVRIGRIFFHEYFQANEVKKNEWRDVFGGFLGATSNVFLPSLSLLRSNANMTEELWVMIKMLPYQMRYRLYGEWKNDSYERHPTLTRMRLSTVERTKYIMRRLTKENVKQSGRQIGKISHGNSLVLFDCILSQIQRYDNLIIPVVDSFKYLTNLSHDTLSYSIIEALANPEKERMKHDDTNISDWLQSLASFCGAIYKKYQIELSGLLQYVANQLKAGKSLDLLILKEVVQKMSGVEISEEVTRDQLEALAGGELLKTEGGYFGQVRNTKKSSNRLKDALLREDLVVPMCVLIAQQRHGIVFNESKEKHLKLVAKLTDQCHDTLVQFGNFLSLQLGIDEYVKRFPSIDRLSVEYYTPADVAFFLSRPMYSHQIASKYDELRRHDRAKLQKSTTADKNNRYITASNNVMDDVQTLVRTMHPEKVWNDISPCFYATFWSLTLYDIQVPVMAYEREINKVKLQIEALQQETSHDTRKRREKERFETMLGKLKEEQRKQEEHKIRVRSRLKHEREKWILAKTSKNDAVTKFLHLCIFPRSIFSPLDAVYCAKFIHVMHLLKTPNFSTLLCFDRVFSDISSTVSCLSENEASRYGRFLCGMLEVVSKWHGDKEVYDKECKNYPGFLTVLRTNASDGANKANNLDYENFRHVCHKWQFKLTKAVVVCLESKNYTQIRNALIILTKVLPLFPIVRSLGNALEMRVDVIRNDEKEKRPDLYALAMGYSGQLKVRKSSMVPEHEYHKKDLQRSKTTTNNNTAPDKPKEVKKNVIIVENEEKKEKTKLKNIAENNRSRSTDRAKSKDKEAKMRSSSSSRHTEKSASKPDEERETKRRKIEAGDGKSVKDDRSAKREKNDKRSRSMERPKGKRDRDNNHEVSVKRHKTENGADGDARLRSKEKVRKLEEKHGKKDRASYDRNTTSREKSEGRHRNDRSYHK